MMCFWFVWLGVNFVYYGVFIWILSIFVDVGFDLVCFFGFILIIMFVQLLGYVVVVWLIEIWGRWVILLVFFFGFVVVVVVFGIVLMEGVIIGVGMVLLFFNFGVWGVLYVVMLEIYFILFCGIGVGWVVGVGWIVLIVVLFFVLVLFGVGGVLVLFVVFGCCFLVVVVVVWGFVDWGGVVFDDW